MAITLKKGQKLSLSKEGLTKATVGLGWLVNQYDTGENADLDSSVFMLGEDGKYLPMQNSFITISQSTLQELSFTKVITRKEQKLQAKTLRKLTLI